jgi:tyrosine-protein phosphatase YwqE
LPDLDCSAKPELSAKLIRNMEAIGIKNIVLTPHFYPDANSNVEGFLTRRNKNVEKLRAALEVEGVTDIRLTVGAEVLLCPGLENLEGLKKLCLGETNSILIEMPDLPWSDDLLESLERIKKVLGLEVVIAHVDRYGKSLAESLISRGYKVQVNADSTVSFSMKRTVCGWVKDGYVYALGSDKHVHSNNKALVYKEFPKAAKILSKYADTINSRSLALIGQ